MDKVKTIVVIYENGDKQFFNNYRAESSKKSKKTKSEGSGAALGSDVAMGYEEAKAIHDAKPTNYTELKNLYEKFYFD